MRTTTALSLAVTALAMMAGPSSARQGSNFNITAAEARAHDCGTECQRVLRLTNAADLDVVGHDFDFDFYATAANFSGSRPGDVLKLKPVDPEERTFRDGTSAFKFQYTSVDLDGKPVPATGFIAFPYAADLGPDAADAGSRGGRGPGTNTTSNDDDDDDDDDDENSRVFKLVAWAHGTIGLFAGCAPSNGPDMFDYTSWQPLTARGYAVVATDYAGLGNNATAHKYCSFDAHAADVYYSVVAARRLFGAALSREWVSVGHSQGGGTAWKLAESRFVRDDAGYLGTVALSPATYVVDMLLGGMGGNSSNGSNSGSNSNSNKNNGNKNNGNKSNGNKNNGNSTEYGGDIDRNAIKYPGYLPYLPLAVERANPDFRSTLLSSTLRKRVQLATAKQLCTNALMGLTFDLYANGGPLVNASGGLAHDTPYMLDWQARHAPALAGARSPAPILVVQGLNDTSVLPPTTERACDASCAAGNAVHLSLYPGVEHSPLPGTAEAEWVGWIDWRFAGGRYAEGAERCSKVTRRAPFGGRWTKTPPEFRIPKFLKNGTP
ncbi:prolyl aminopeptidase (secreted protein) [Purpureocillium lavendulum]|uniref:Prolyl aminopeptidase (Secreted protein) n=1 Tax=Purpureocillium lavendulum TaxID=1247861 RepID=A0AB34FM82_9HYPO|nr:prolyl aminopeptidase (secreted protein) [Purpureocillium lavendulum]